MGVGVGVGVGLGVPAAVNVKSTCVGLYVSLGSSAVGTEPVEFVVANCPLSAFACTNVYVALV